MNAYNKELPQPDLAAVASSLALIDLIRTEIDANAGKISFARYMELVLYAPGLGYYANNSQKFGQAGDFVTAPEVSYLYSACLAQQIQQVFTDLTPKSTDISILEFGAGSGRMAADILQVLDEKKALPDHYLILELSAELQHRQRQTILATVPHLLSRVQWLDQLPERGLTGVIVANELIDAMPVHRFKVTKSPDGSHKGEDLGLCEYYVGWRENKLVWLCDQVSTPRLTKYISNIGGALPQDYISEVNLAADAWIKTIAEVLENGMLLLVDYGFAQREYYHYQRSQGTLMCHYRHRVHDDPFMYPGLQDITAHVNFTAIAESAQTANLDVAGYTTQANFLLDCGITDIAQNLQVDDYKQQLQLSQQIKTLTLPSEMGELFKVIALTRALTRPLLGFSSHDMRAKL